MMHKQTTFLITVAILVAAVATQALYNVNIANAKILDPNTSTHTSNLLNSTTKAANSASSPGGGVFNPSDSGKFTSVIKP